LVVGEDDERLDAESLEPYPLSNGSEVVPEMQLPGWSFSGENSESTRVGGDASVEIGHT
jgi:hypothetical protein